MKKGSLRRGVFAMLLVASTVGASACVLPGEFAGVDDACEEGRFDAASRDAYCSGTVRSGLVYRQEDSFQEGARPLMDVQGPYIAWAEWSPSAAALQVRILKSDDGFSYREINRGEIALGEEERLFSFAVMNMNDGNVNSGDVQVAIVSSDRRNVEENRDLRFVRLNEGKAVELVSPSLVLGANSGSSGEEESPFEETSCVKEARQRLDNPYLVTGMTAFSSRHQKFAGRRYLMVGTECAMVVYGQDANVDSLGDRPASIVEYPISALDIHVSREQDRMVVAAGRDGLQVRRLSVFEDSLDATMEQIFDDLAGDPSDCGDGCNADSGGNNDSPEPGVPEDGSGDNRGAFTPSVGEDKRDLYAEDPVGVAATNVAHVGFARDKIFYINEPLQGEVQEDSDKLSYLVAGRLDGNNVLSGRKSIALTSLNAEGEVADFRWHVAGLGDSLAAVLGNRVDGQGEILSSRLLIFDAPGDNPPVLVHEVPLSGVATSIRAEGEELWVTFPDSIASFEIRVGGESK